MPKDKDAKSGKPKLDRAKEIKREAQKKLEAAMAAKAAQLVDLSKQVRRLPRATTPQP